MSKVLFLDIDGVLNGHEVMSNHYNRLRPDLVDRINELLIKVPELKLVISSAWRYPVFSGDMTVKGLECLFLTHGLACYGKIVGITISDEEMAEVLGYKFKDQECWYAWLKIRGTDLRCHQIYKYAVDHRISQFAVLDDLDLEMPELVQTDGTKGLQDSDVIKVLAYLNADTV